MDLTKKIKVDAAILELLRVNSSSPQTFFKVEKPSCDWVTPMLTDFYQISMAYAYFCMGRHETPSVFEAFIRKNPFQGEYTLFAGLTEFLRFVKHFRYTPEDITYLRKQLPEDAPEEFFEYMSSVDTSKVKVFAIGEGLPVFSREPLVRLEGPLLICQLLETTLLNLLNFPTLVATNAARMRYAAGPDKVLLEFGLRRAQGPDGGMSASRYSMIGGFDGTSNVQAGQVFDVDVRGTHAHSFVAAFQHPSSLKNNRSLGDCEDFWAKVVDTRSKLKHKSQNEDELIAFVAYALAFPHAFSALVDTYDTLQSGVPNFLAVAVAMHDLGYRAKGIRVDSGDLARLSRESKALFAKAGNDLGIDLSYLSVMVSSDINEEKLWQLAESNCSIDSYGIGTNLVTCQAQPALGMVFKLMEIDGEPVIKLSNEKGKVTIPGSKRVFRLLNEDSVAIGDVMALHDEPPPVPNKTVKYFHPYDSAKHQNLTPNKVVEVLSLVMDGGRLVDTEKSSLEIRDLARESLNAIPDAHRRYKLPVEYPVLLSCKLNDLLHTMCAAKGAKTV